MTQYTNAQLRSIFYGLGYVAREFVDVSLGFPVTTDNSALTTPRMTQAIRQFQADYGLGVDGIIGPKTRAKLEEVMRILQYQLNLVVKAGLPQDQPFYGQKTVAAVKKFEAQIGVAQDGVATRDLRVRLNELAKAKV